MSRISFEVSPAQHKQIKALALMEGVTVRSLLWSLCATRLTQHHNDNKKSARKKHDDCPLCEALGETRQYNKKTQAGLARSRKEKSKKRYASMHELMADLGIR